MENESDVETSEEDVRRLALGFRWYGFLWKIFVCMGVVALFVLAMEWLSDSEFLTDEQAAASATAAQIIKSVIAYLWPLLLICMPAIYVFTFSRGSIDYLPLWMLLWMPLSIAYGHSMLVQELFRSGIFGADKSHAPNWNLVIFNGKYVPYSIAVALKGAALDFVESFQIAVPQPDPSQQVTLFRGVEFAFRTTYSAWGALVLIKAYSLLRRRRRIGL